MLSQVGFLETEPEVIYYRSALRRRGEGKQDETGKLLSKEKVVLAGLYLRPDSMSCL